MILARSRLDTPSAISDRLHFGHPRLARSDDAGELTLRETALHTLQPEAARQSEPQFDQCPLFHCQAEKLAGIGYGPPAVQELAAFSGSHRRTLATFYGRSR
jgi:hypothetical protein